MPDPKDDPTRSILDATPRPPTSATAALEKRLRSTAESAKGIEASLNAHISSRLLSIPGEPSEISPPGTARDTPKTPPAFRRQPELPPPPFPDLESLYTHRTATRELAKLGTEIDRSRTYDPLTYIINPPSPAAVTLPMLLASQSHLGHATSLWNPQNSGYIFGIRDGIHIIDLSITAAYLRRAAKIVTEVARRGGIILFVGTRDGQEDMVVNAAKLAGGYHIFDRWTPGSLTNGQQILGHCRLKVVDVMDRELPRYQSMMSGGSSVPVLRPDLVVCLNPLENEVCLHECGLFNVPTIGVIDTDASPSRVTYPIPANDDSLRCMTLLSGVLGRAGEEGQRLRMEAASRGEATYDTRAAEQILRAIEAVKGLGHVTDNRGPVDR